MSRHGLDLMVARRHREGLGRGTWGLRLGAWDLGFADGLPVSRSALRRDKAAVAFCSPTANLKVGQGPPYLGPATCAAP